jgi:hypothetical protein
MALHDGDNQGPDWLDRWCDKLRTALQTHGPPARDWVKRWLQRITDAAQRAWPPTREWTKSNGEKAVIATRRAWPPTRDWIERTFQRWRELPAKGKRVFIGVGCGALLLIVLAVVRSSYGPPPPTVHVDDDGILIKYATGEMDGNDEVFIDSEGRKIATLVWRAAQKYPDPKGTIMVMVTYGGRGKIWSDDGRVIKNGEFLTVVFDDLLRVRTYGDENSFVLAKHRCTRDLIIDPYHGQPFRVNWKGDHQIYLEGSKELETKRRNKDKKP